MISSSGPRMPLNPIPSGRCPASKSISRIFFQRRDSFIFLFPSCSPFIQFPSSCHVFSVFHSVSSRTAWLFSTLLEGWPAVSRFPQIKNGGQTIRKELWRYGISTDSSPARFCFPVLPRPRLGHHPAYPFPPLSVENAATSTPEPFWWISGSCGPETESYRWNIKENLDEF